MFTHELRAKPASITTRDIRTVAEGVTPRRAASLTKALARDIFGVVPTVDISMSQITDWESFHDTFAEALGFPDFYGRNMDAWIDCLAYEDDGMTSHPVEVGDVLTLQLIDCRAFRTRCPEIYGALMDCAAFVNWSRIELGDPPILALSYGT